MGRRISSGGGRGLGGGGFRGSRISSGFRSSGFKPRTSYNYGGFRRHYRPYRRNYLFHSLGPTGKIIYIIIVLILLLVSLSM